MSLRDVGVSSTSNFFLLPCTFDFYLLTFSFMLFLVATPIGNLKDITLRALEVLKSADVIASEDTRRTGQLLKHYGIERRGGVTPPLLSFHDHSGPGRLQELVSLLKEGKHVALVTDSGTPLISDPGFPLVREAVREGIRIEALPGPTALVTALVASGLPTERFAFWGFLPARSGAPRKELEKAAGLEHTLVFFESPYRLLKTMELMEPIFPDRRVVVARELTKKHEEILRGFPGELKKEIHNRKVLGEVTVVVEGRR